MKPALILALFVACGIKTMGQPTSKTNNDPTCPRFQEMGLLLKRLNDLEGELDRIKSYALPYDCAEIKTQDSMVRDGVFSIRPSGGPSKQVYCDMSTDGGGWLVFQRRVNGSEDFYRNWNDYQVGFGSVNGEFWIGNDALHLITSQRPYELRVDMEDFDGNKVSIMYSYFAIGDASTNYTLSVGGYLGTAGDCLSSHIGQQFTTFDRDNDLSTTRNCANQFKGAWWYNACHDSNFNGIYFNPSRRDGRGIRCYQYKPDSLKATEMKIRPSGLTM